MATKAPKNPHDKHPLSRRRLREWGYGYLFILPWLIGVCIFFLYAAGRSIYFSFVDVLIGGADGLAFEALPNIFQNYINVFTTEVNFPITLGSFALSLVLQLPIIISFSLIIALLLNSKIRCRGIFRMIFFLPVIIATGPVMNMLTAQGVASVPMMTDMTALLGGLPSSSWTR